MGDSVGHLGLRTPETIYIVVVRVQFWFSTSVTFSHKKQLTTLSVNLAGSDIRIGQDIEGRK